MPERTAGGAAMADGTGTAPSAVQVPTWRRRFGVVAGVTDRAAGDFGLLGHQPVGPVVGRWRGLSRRLGFDAVVTSHQVHGAAVAIHRTRTPGWLLLDGYDAHLTSQRGLLLTITVADCIPVFAIDPVRGVLALAHAGWRGTAAGVLGAVVEKMVEQFGSVRTDLVMHLGVGICGACYQVGSEVFSAVGHPVPAGGVGHLDLRGVLRAQATTAGVRSVTVAADCSAHQPRFLSHRASGGADGRMVAYLGLPLTVTAA